MTLLMLLTTMTACGPVKRSKDHDSQPAASGDAQAASTPAPSDTAAATAATPDINTGIGDLFKDNADFAPADLMHGFIACAGLESLTTSAGATISWPEKMRAYLAAELSKFPDTNLILSSVSGI
jgi:hypothetical protein